MRLPKIGLWCLLCISLLGCALWGRPPTPAPVFQTTPKRVATRGSDTPSATVHPSATPAAEISQSTTRLSPRPSPTALPSPAPTAPELTLLSPRAGDSIGNPVHVQGEVILGQRSPLTLSIRMYDGRDQLVADLPVQVQGTPGERTTFETEVQYGGVPGTGRIEVMPHPSQQNAEGVGTSVTVALQGLPGGGYVEMPAPFAQTTLPLRLLARVGEPGQQVNVTVQWEDGTQFARLFTTLPGLDGRGLVITALDWVIVPRPSHPATQPGQVQIHAVNGQLLAWQPVQLLHPEDPQTMHTDVYWVEGEQTVATSVAIPRTLGIGRAALNVLLWGPVPGNASAYTTAIPTPEDILRYPLRGPEWGERVRLQALRIADGVAYADFSGEILAHTGGAAQVLLMRAQIEHTLLQFSTVDQVVITVEGNADMLEP